ncbi:MAG: hypothetical protein H8E40_04990 [Chloroflexi bacterium]|nr:hypothetical protein [Chloroflexota bacterium]MBL7061292.1 hypothetical protein [Dehalococcoidia bacterium]
MNNSAVIAVVGTLLGVITSAILAYFFQRRVSETQRKWALEDEERRNQKTYQDEKRKMKHALIQKRIDIIEEATALMDSVISMTFDHACGFPSAKDTHVIKKIEERLQEILPSAWNAVSVVGSDELQKNFEVLSRTSIIMMDEDSEAIDFDAYQEAQGAPIAIAKILDKMRLED